MYYNTPSKFRNTVVSLPGIFGITPSQFRHTVVSITRYVRYCTFSIKTYCCTPDQVCTVLHLLNLDILLYTWPGMYGITPSKIRHTVVSMTKYVRYYTFSIKTYCCIPYQVCTVSHHLNLDILLNPWPAIYCITPSQFRHSTLSLTNNVRYHTF
jgi:hypothetical protein